MSTTESFVAFVDAGGTIRWRVPVAYGEQNGLDVAVGPDGSVAWAICTDELVEVGGETFEPIGGSDLVVGKLSPAGDPLWTHRFGGEFNERCGGIAIDGDGQVIIGGGYDSAFSLGVSVFALGAQNDSTSSPRTPSKSGSVRHDPFTHTRPPTWRPTNTRTKLLA
jgi:hypothetical protein